MDKKTIFRPAVDAESHVIWQILQGAIARRKADGSNQWQDGYPNPEVIAKDLQKGGGYVLVEGSNIIGYVAIMINDEPEYARLKGNWLTNDDFVVFHRVAVADSHLGKGVAKELFLQIEEFARSNDIRSIKADTNFDNAAMLHLFDSFQYIYCGEVTFRGTPRRAYEKVLL